VIPLLVVSEKGQDLIFKIFSGMVLEEGKNLKGWESRT